MRMRTKRSNEDQKEKEQKKSPNRNFDTETGVEGSIANRGWSVAKCFLESFVIFECETGRHAVRPLLLFQLLDLMVDNWCVNNIPNTSGFHCQSGLGSRVIKSGRNWLTQFRLPNAAGRCGGCQCGCREC